MKSKSVLSFACVSLLVSALLDLVPPPLWGQDEPEAEEPKKGKGRKEKNGSPFNLGIGSGLTLTYDDNVFRLDEGQKDDLKQDTGVNNRFDDMDSVDDFLVRAHGRLEIGWRSFGGKDAEVRFEPAWTWYTMNELKSYGDFRLQFAHETWKRGEIFLEGGYIPSRFRKNYFANGVDSNGDANISKDERTYDHGIYQEGEVWGGLRSRLAGDLSGEVALGYRKRAYDSPFENRDEDSLGVTAELKYDLGGWVEVGGNYFYERESTDDGLEPVLIDETVQGEVDGIPGLVPNALVQTSVDRSNHSHEFGPYVKVRLSKAVTVSAFYHFRFRSFTSDNPLDLDYNGREDRRHEAGVRIQLRYNKWTQMMFGYTWSQNRTDRPARADLNGDEFDYRTNTFEVGLELRF